MTELDLNRNKVNTAVEAVLKLSSVKDGGTKKKDLVEAADEGNVLLQIILKKIPPKEKSINLHLPHSIKRPDAEVCLFVKDLDRKERDYEPTVQHFQELLAKHKINSVTQIVPLKSLKTEHKVYEAKRNLSNGFDMFLADERIVRHLPHQLGKHFYSRVSKFPIQVNLLAKDLAKEISGAIGSSRCVVSNKGSSSMACVGHTSMKQSDIVDNIITCCSLLAKAVTGGPKNIKQLLIKAKASTSIPIFLSESRPQDVTIPKELHGDDVEAEEISTLMGAKVKVYPSGDVEVIKDSEVDKGNPLKNTGARKKATKRKRSNASSKPSKKVKKPRKQGLKSTKSNKKH